MTPGADRPVRGVTFRADCEGPALALVVAVAENGAIGAAGDLPWRISDDLKWFKRITVNKPVIMGRKTFESIGKPLPSRDNIVVSRSSAEFDGAISARDIDTALDRANACAEEKRTPEICVIGGAEVYAQTLRRADRIYLTKVAAQPVGDAFFPEINPDQWRIRRLFSVGASDQNDYPCEFFILDRLHSGA
ncbi:MAG: dihydrofolate reductase [Pseudomonadota bacterium]